jgi:hypothetical protein
LQSQTLFSKNLVIATLDTLYKAGIVDVQCLGKGKGKTNRIKVNNQSFEKYDKYTIDELLNNPEIRIETVKYKNNYTPYYLKIGKKICKKVNTNVDNIDNKENINNIIDNKSVVIDIPTIELKEGNTSPGTPNACQPVKSRLDSFDLASANKLPDMERRLEHQYYYVLKDLPALEKNHYSFTEACYLKETLDWVEATEDFPVLTNCMLMWYDGGRAKLAEMVQGLAPNVTKDILTYLVLSGKYYDAQTSMNNYQPVYSV